MSRWRVGAPAEEKLAIGFTRVFKYLGDAAVHTHVGKVFAPPFSYKCMVHVSCYRCVCVCVSLCGWEAAPQWQQLE